MDRTQQASGPSTSTRQIRNESTGVHAHQGSISNETASTSDPDRQPRPVEAFPWLNLVKATLTLFEKTLASVPAPGLKGVIGGVLNIIEIYDKAAQNKKDFEELKRSVDKLNALFKCFVDERRLPIPDELSHRIKTVSKHVSDTSYHTFFDIDYISLTRRELEDTNLQIEQGLTRGIFRGMVDAPDNAQLVVELFRKIKFSIDKLTVVSVVKTEAIAWIILELSERALLDKLPRAKTARWNYVKIDECMQGTRGTVLAEIKERIFNKEKERIQWLNGLAGTGKSTLAKSVAHSLADESQLGASFFCARDEPDRSNVDFIFPTIAFQLSETVLGFAAELIKVIRDKIDIGYAQPPDQLHKLIIEPLQKIGSHSQPILIIIDAPDECKDQKASSVILTSLFQCIDAVPFLKVFVTSRPEEDVRQTFRLLKNRSNVLDLHLIDRTLVDDDIRHFLNIRLTEMAKNRSITDLTEKWPSPALVERLVQKAAGSFIFASTIGKAINFAGDLDQELEQAAKLPTDKEGRLGIDGLYRRVLESAIKGLSNQEVSDCCFVLGTIILLQTPLTLTNLSQLLCRTRGNVNGLLSKFHSVLAIPRQGETGVIRIIHASFHDFLTDEERCSGKFLVQPALHHQEIVMLLFKCMMESLGGEVDDVVLNDILAYACRYWADHLTYCQPDGGDTDKLIAALEIFVETKCSRWTKTLADFGDADSTATALQKARRWYSQILQPRPELIQWLRANLADAFDDEFGRIGVIRDLDEAIAVHREIIEQRPTPHPDRWKSLDKLAFVLFNRFEQRPAPHPDRWISLDKLAIVLSKTGRLADLDEAIALCREILEQRPATHPDRSSSLDNLSIVPLSRFDQTSFPQDVITHREALRLQPGSDRWRSLDDLAFFLFMRFNQTHRPADKEEAFVLHCKALRLLENINRPRKYLISNVPNPRQHFYKIHRNGDEYFMDAGTVHGISIGDEFDVYEDVNSAMGTLVVLRVDAFSSRMGQSAYDPPLQADLITPAFALQMKATGEYLRLHAAEDVMSMLNYKVFDMHVVFVDSIPEADISFQRGHVVLNTPLAVKFGPTCIPFSIVDNINDVNAIIRAMTHYHRHLHSANLQCHLKKSVQIEFTKLKEVKNRVDDDLFPLIEPDGPNLNECGVVNLVVDDEADMYGIRIVNRSKLDLYPHLFWFNNGDMSIESYYEPAQSYGRSEVDAPLRSKEFLTVGYGTGGSAPFRYFVGDGQDINVGFLKLFLTSRRADLSDIPQPSPFAYHRAAFKKTRHKIDVWDAIVVPVVQRRRNRVF